MKNGIRKMLFICITFLTFFSFNFKVNANTITNNNVVITSNIKTELNRNITKSVVSCDNLLGDPDDSKSPAFWLQWVLDLMKYVAIIALLVLIILDFLKAIANNDKDALKKAGSTSMKRFIYCVLLFFVPTIVKLILELFGIYGNCGIG